MGLTFIEAIIGGIKLGLFGLGIVFVIFASITAIVLVLVALELLIEFGSWLRKKYKDFM